MGEASTQSGERGLAVRTTYVLPRLTRLVQRQLEERLAPHGLTIPQFTTLSVLIRRPGLSNAQLARRAYITPQSMQEVLRTLEQLGLVRRSPAPENQRILRATLTPAGRRLAERADRAAAEIEQAMFVGLTDGERAAFTETLLHCVAQLGGGLDRASKG